MYVLFFFNDTATTEIYTLSLHDALPILDLVGNTPLVRLGRVVDPDGPLVLAKIEYLNPGGSVKDRIAIRMVEDRKSTRLNSSHANISYAGFCLKKKKNICPHTINIAKLP